MGLYRLVSRLRRLKRLRQTPFEVMKFSFRVARRLVEVETARNLTVAW
jgi:hypothetical protein